MGYVFQRKGGWYIAYRGRDGRIIRESARTRRKFEANELLRAKEHEVRQATILGLPVQSDIRLDEFTDEYMKYAAANKKPSSVRRDDVSLKRLLPIFGRKMLREITPGAIQRYVDNRRLMKGHGRPRVAAATICNEIHTLSAIFREAVRRELVGNNPVAKVKRPKEDNTIVRYLTPDEEKALLREVPDRIRPIVIVALHTGMRLGEILGLHWADVDFDQRLIVVRDTKSNRKRYLPINDLLLETLKSLSETSEGPQVFVSPKTGDMYDNIKRSWASTLRRAEIEKFRFHDLRHTFASRLVQRGVDITVVRELLGHRDLSTTQRYAHLSATDLYEAVQRLGGKSGRKRGKRRSSDSRKEQKD